jgi:photosystem II stability/assembly factor-like uncharacterized protein
MVDAPILMTGLRNGVVSAERLESGDWRITRALEGKDVRCLVKDPVNSNTAFAGTRHAGVWRTADRGRTWSQLGMVGQIVTALTVSPHDSRLLYAGSKPALLFRSEDGGMTWEEMGGFRKIPNRWWWFSPADPPDRRPYVISVDVSPEEPDTMVAGVELGGVFRSTDGGLTWSRHVKHTLRDCHALMFHHADGNFVYEAGGTGGGAAISTDGGVTWEKRREGLAYHYGVVCAADAVDPSIWYVCVGQSPGKVHGPDPEAFLYRSSNDSSWEPIGWQDHPLVETPTALTTTERRIGELFAGLRNGDVWHSADRGDTWRKMPFNLTGMGSSLVYFESQP